MVARGGRGNRGRRDKYVTMETFEGLQEQVIQLTPLATQALGNQNHRNGSDNGSDLSDTYQLALKVESRLSRSISKKAGFDRSNNASTSKVDNRYRGGRTIALLHSNQSTSDNSRKVF
ncbi:hypothetical protein M9H77_21319 [Catharanthus roseus]|uniref:Uncharacterized protein n=1 Tax=Catharanthus roseus TaxID=4058 RepID=A0ACC0ARA0_CATRO|nr:hypothetical protein M9H77_21319 [Catharanthus roseus]